MQKNRDDKYLRELAKTYPNRQSALSEIINLNAILNLPKGTEHFMSDLHGEHEAFVHIRKNASGVIRKKIDLLFYKTLTLSEREELSTLIYYPKEKLEETSVTDEWYRITLLRLLEICRLVSSKYTRSKVRKHLAKTAKGYEYIIDELLNNDYDEVNKESYYDEILKTIIRLGVSKEFLIAICSAIKSLVIDHLHIVGDIFDRGPRPDIILDELTEEASIDIQWGNHDILWMGAAAGSEVCIATVLNNSITYKNMDVIEIGYGISLRPLSLFANETYGHCDVSGYMPKNISEGDSYRKDDDILIARMHKAISIIQFKLEAEVIRRNPDFHMEDRLLLDKIDYETNTLIAGGHSVNMKDTDFPTVNRQNPYELTDEEKDIMKYLKNAFTGSEKLKKHISFLFEKGEMYTVFNNNLLFHGCIPMDEDGEFMKFDCAGGKSGKELMDYCDRTARQGYFAKDGSEARQHGKDFLWFLWCGRFSPLNARGKIATFERLFTDDKEAQKEEKNAYYNCWDSEDLANKVLQEFSLEQKNSHIINGHIPVQRSRGENPLKANGKVILIDGGFCKAYQESTGIAGYTLIYNAEGMRISAHEPFRGVKNAIENNADIVSDTVVFEEMSDKIRVRDTDTGRTIANKIDDLTALVKSFEEGRIKETGIQ